VTSPVSSDLLLKPSGQLVELRFYLAEQQFGCPRPRDHHQIPAATPLALSVTEPGTNQAFDPIAVVGLAHFPGYGQSKAAMASLCGGPCNDEMAGPKGPRVAAMALILAALADPQRS